MTPSARAGNSRAMCAQINFATYRALNTLDEQQ
jgi:hypothetical protein